MGLMNGVQSSVFSKHNRIETSQTTFIATIPVNAIDCEWHVLRKFNMAPCFRINDENIHTEHRIRYGNSQFVH